MNQPRIQQPLILPPEVLRFVETADLTSTKAECALRVASHSPAALDGLFALLKTTGRMQLSSRVQRAIGLRVGKLLQCEGISSACGLEENDVEQFRRGLSRDPHEQVLLALATKLVTDRGHHAALAVESAREVGVTDAEILEVLTLVATHSLMSSIVCVAGIESEPPTPNREE